MGLVLWHSHWKKRWVMGIPSTLPHQAPEATVPRRFCLHLHGQSLRIEDLEQTAHGKDRRGNKEADDTCLLCSESPANQLSPQRYRVRRDHDNTVKWLGKMGND